MLSSRLSALTLFLFSFLLILVFLPETTTANEVTAPLAHKRMLKRHGPAPAILRSKRDSTGGSLLPLTDTGSDTDTGTDSAQNVGNSPAAGGSPTTTGTAPSASSSDPSNPSDPTTGGTTGNGNTGTTTGNGNPDSGGTTDNGNTGDDGGNGGIIPVGGLLGGNGASTTSGTSTSTTSTSTTSTSTTSTSTPSASSIAPVTPVDITTSTNTVFTQTQPTADPARVSQEATQTRLSQQTIIILIVIASCVGGAALIWTIIRKWKFRPSSRFDNRLDPIEWQPAGPSSMGDDGGMIERHARNGSVNSQTDASSIRRNLYAPDNNTQSLAPDFPPAHDFTAVPSGGPMYGRGPSPQPYGRSGAAGGGYYGGSGGYEFSRGY